MERPRFMPGFGHRSAAVCTLLLALCTFGGPASGTGGDPRRSPSPALRERIAERGAVRVIVKLTEPSPPWWTRILAMERSARRSAIEAEQERILSELAESVGAPPSRVRRFRDIPFLALDADSALLPLLERSTRVVSIEEDRLLAPALNQTLPIIGADLAADAGYDGTGWAIAVIDTGVDAGHAFLSGRVVAEACFSANASCPNGAPTQIGPGAATYCDWATSCFHGTHVAGIAAGSTSFLEGVAPGAAIVAIQVFSEFSGSICNDSPSDPCALAYTSDIVAGLEHANALRAALDIAAVNMSLGGGAWTTQAACDDSNATLKAAIDTLRDAGVVSVVSSGNAGLDDAMGAPACISSAVSVGATDDFDNVAAFSNSADFLTLLAPGVSVTSSVPLGLLGFEYGIASGTSMAAPHVAGAWAIARQADPGASVDTILGALQETGPPILDRNGVATPRISISAALAALGVAAPAACGSDTDGDGVCDPADNCSERANAAQIDSDLDGFGNACDADYDNDGDIDALDFLRFRGTYEKSVGDAEFDPLADSNGDGTIDGQDFIFVRESYGQVPGPSGLACAGAVPCPGP